MMSTAADQTYLTRRRATPRTWLHARTAAANDEEVAPRNPRLSPDSD